MISIIVPVYNVEKYIAKTIERIENQTYRDFELILINDGSTDNSLEIAQKKLKFSNIDWMIINQDNIGQAASRNVGVHLSKGEYVSFIDSDDEINENFLLDLHEALVQTEVNIVFCGFDFVKFRSGNRVKKVSKEIGRKNIEVFSRDEILSIFLKRNIEIIIPAFLIKKEFLITQKIEFDDNARFSEDQIFIWKCFHNANKVAYVNKKNYYYIQRTNSIMTSTSVKKILTGFASLSSFVKNENIRIDIAKYIIPRWVLGALYSASKSLSYNEFFDLYNIMDGKKLSVSMKGFSEIRASSLAMISKSAKLLYIFCRYII